MPVRPGANMRAALAPQHLPYPRLLNVKARASARLWAAGVQEEVVKEERVTDDQQRVTDDQQKVCNKVETAPSP